MTHQVHLSHSAVLGPAHCKPGKIQNLKWFQPMLTGPLTLTSCIFQSFCPYETINKSKTFSFFQRFWKFLKKGLKMSIFTQTAHPKFPTTEKSQKFEILPEFLGVPFGCQYHFQAIFWSFFKKQWLKVSPHKLGKRWSLDPQASPFLT